MTLILATKGHELLIWLGHRNDFQIWTQILVGVLPPPRLPGSQLWLSLSSLDSQSLWGLDTQVIPEPKDQ